MGAAAGGGRVRGAAWARVRAARVLAGWRKRARARGAAARKLLNYSGDSV
jgi:hypothetical protein